MVEIPDDVAKREDGDLYEYIPGRTWDAHADAVLAVVADWLAALFKAQRDHDVALIRGGGDRG